MNSPRIGLRVAGAVFGIVGLGHLIRLLWQPKILVAGWPLPLWLNAVGFIFAGGLSLWMWKISGRISK